MALLASRACTVASSRIQWGGPDMEALGEEMEGWAIGVLSAVPSQDTANRILSKALEGNNMAYSVVDIALRLGMKEFISHRYVQTRLIWSGEARNASQQRWPVKSESHCPRTSPFGSSPSEPLCQA